MLPQHSLSAVLRYAPAISATLNTFGKEIVKINPAPLSLQTYSNRLRDAMNGQVKYQHQNVPFSTSKLIELRGDIMVCERDGFILAGDRALILSTKKPPEATSGIELFAGEQVVGLLINAPVINIVTSLVWLHHYKILINLSKLTNADNEVRNWLTDNMNNFDISVIFNPNGDVVII